MSAGKEALKVLCVHWYVKSYEFCIKTNRIYEESKTVIITKRNVLSIIASIYDPLGMIAPIVIRFKVFFQKIAEMKVNWDEQLADNIRSEWLRLIELFTVDASFRMDRYYFRGMSKHKVNYFMLHGFCDDSEIAYAAVIYIVGETKEIRKSAFVVSKTKVAPIKKKLSMPKLELCAYELLSKLMKNVMWALSGVIDIRDSVLERFDVCALLDKK